MFARPINKVHMRKRFHLVGFVLLLNILAVPFLCSAEEAVQTQETQRNSIIKIKTEQNAIVWLDDVRRGTPTDPAFLTSIRLTPADMFCGLEHLDSPKRLYH